MNEEVTIRFAADLTAVGRGLRSLKSMMKEASHGINEMFTELFTHLAGPLSVGGMVIGFEKVLSKVQAITRLSESLGVSTDFVQDIQNVAAASGLAGEKVEKMLDKFVKGLPAGADVEQEYGNIADKIASIEDPAQRARIAVDAFGKSGVQLVPVLARGRDGIKEFASEFSKFTKDDIKHLEEAKLELERFGNFITIWSGRLLIGAEFISKVGVMMTRVPVQALQWLAKNTGIDLAVANMFGRDKAPPKINQPLDADKDVIQKYLHHLREIQLRNAQISYDQKHATLDQMYVEEAKAAKASKTENERVSHLTKMADLKESLIELETKHKKEIEKQKDLELERSRQYEHSLELGERALDIAKRSELEGFQDRSKFTLQELADMGHKKFYSGHRGQESYAEMTAIDIQDLEQRTKQARNFGYTGRADWLQSRADELRKSIGYAITASESDPMRSLQEASEKAEEHLRWIKEKGLKVSELPEE